MSMLYDCEHFTSGSDGVVVTILSNDEQGFWTFDYDRDFYDVPPRTLASFAIRPRRVKRMQPSHGNCSDVNPLAVDLNLASTLPYELTQCV